MRARCRPGQKTGCNSVEEFFKIAILCYMLMALAQRQKEDQ